MGYDLHLIREDGNVVKVPSFTEGGHYVVGGSVYADISITYNYSKFFYDTIDNDQGIRWIYGRAAGDCIDRLESAIGVLGTDKDDDYWKPTAGNAGWILSTLLKWAKQHPECKFEGD